MGWLSAGDKSARGGPALGGYFAMMRARPVFAEAIPEGVIQLVKAEVRSASRI